MHIPMDMVHADIQLWYVANDTGMEIDTQSCGVDQEKGRQGDETGAEPHLDLLLDPMIGEVRQDKDCHQEDEDELWCHLVGDKVTIKGEDGLVPDENAVTHHA